MSEHNRNFLSKLFGAKPVVHDSGPAAPADPPPPPQSAIPKGFTPISEHSPEDVFVVGYPKSGNTWSQYLIAGAVYGVDLETVYDSLVKDLVPDVYERLFYKRYSPVAFFKSHALPQPDYRRVIYLLRDGRDVMVSYFHYLEAMHRKPMDYLHLLNTGEHLFPCRWHEHVDQWLANPYGSQMIVVRYEDLKKDTVQELRRICEFLQLSREEAQLRLAARRASFLSLQKREATWGRENPLWPKDKKFIRRGVVGSYADEMPLEAQRLFLQQSGATMQKVGYLEAAPPVPDLPAADGPAILKMTATGQS